MRCLYADSLGKEIHFHSRVGQCLQHYDAILMRSFISYEFELIRL